MCHHVIPDAPIILKACRKRFQIKRQSRHKQAKKPKRSRTALPNAIGQSLRSAQRTQVRIQMIARRGGAHTHTAEKKNQEKSSPSLEHRRRRPPRSSRGIGKNRPRCNRKVIQSFFACRGRPPGERREKNCRKQFMSAGAKASQLGDARRTLVAGDECGRKNNAPEKTLGE